MYINKITLLKTDKLKNKWIKIYWEHLHDFLLLQFFKLKSLEEKYHQISEKSLKCEESGQQQIWNFIDIEFLLIIV